MKLFEITEGMYSIDQSIRDAFNKLPNNQKYNRIADIVYKVTRQKVSPREVAEEIHHSGIDDFIDWVSDFDKATYDYKPLHVNEGEQRSEIIDRMKAKCEAWLDGIQPGQYLGYDDLQSDMYDFARLLTHDDLNSPDDLRNFMSNPGSEADQVVQDVLANTHNVAISDLFAENFADGKKPGRKGLAKRSGVNTKASVSSLRKTAKNSTGEKQRMAHWLANMKSGKKKSK